MQQMHDTTAEQAEEELAAHLAEVQLTEPPKGATLAHGMQSRPLIEPESGA